MDSHPIFTKDPREWKKYVYNEVTVESLDGKVHQGLVYTIDPVSQTVVLVKFKKDGHIDLEMIMGHNVGDITIVNDDTEMYHSKLDCLFTPAAQQTLTEKELLARKEKVKNWLEQNRIPVTVSGLKEEVLNVSDALSIVPPYDANCCQSTNEIILGRIQDLIKNIP